MGRSLAGLKAAEARPAEKPEEKRPGKEKVGEKKPRKIEPADVAEEAKRPERERPAKAAEGVLEKKIERKEGFFLGAGVTRVAVWGNFDGVSTVSGDGVTDEFPVVNGAFGLKLIGGYQFEKGSIEFNYSHSNHEGDRNDQERTVRRRSYSIDGKVFPSRQIYRVQPLLSLGAGYNTLTVVDGSTNGVIRRDAKFKGWDIRFGGGAEILLTERFALDFLAIYRWGAYTSVDGILSRSIDSQRDGNGITASVETKFVF